MPHHSPGFWDWPVFVFCRCRFPLGYWCASLPRRPARSVLFVKLTPGHTHAFVVLLVGGGKGGGTLTISVKLLEEQERQTVYCIFSWFRWCLKVILFPGKANVPTCLWSGWNPFYTIWACWLQMTPKIKTALPWLTNGKWRFTSLIMFLVFYHEK